MDAEKTGNILKKLGLKVTRKRIAVMLCLSDANSYLSAGEVRLHLERRNLSVGLPTVYRILDELASAGVVTRIFMPDSKQYFFLCSNPEHHHHFVCETCGCVDEIEHCGLEGVIGDIARRFGGNVTSHIFQINGVCDACVSSERREG